MKFQSPSLVELHAFLAVCRYGSFRQAADTLCVSQGAVSRAVQRLEQHLDGCRLFERTSMGVNLTERGRQLRDLTERHVMGLEAASQAFARTSESHPVRLSVIPTLGTQWLIPRLPAFRSQHPEVRIELRQFKYDDNFTRSDVDCWIDVKRPSRPWPDHVQATYLLGNELVPVCAPELRAQFAAPSDLLAATLLHHIGFPDNWQRWFQAVGVTAAPTLGPGFDLSINLIVAAKAGMGVAIVPHCLAERELRAGELVLLSETSVASDRGYFFCSHQDSRASAAQAVFFEWLKGQAEITNRAYGDAASDLD